MSPLADVHNSRDIVFLLGVLIVVGALVSAGYCAYIRNFLGAGILLAVAIVAAFLLL